jgi:hypothetical protein
MLDPTNKEILALATCPPKSVPDGELPPLDQIDVRMEIQRTALLDLTDFLSSCLCDNLVSIGAALKKMEGHLKRLVGKELKGTGVSLARIAQYLEAIVANQTAEHGLLLSHLMSQSLLPGPSAPTEPVVPEEPVFILPQYAQPDPEVFIGVAPATVEPTPPTTVGPLPLEPAPEFQPETSAAVGGETFAAPAGEPTSFLFPKADPLKELYIDLPREA